MFKSLRSIAHTIILAFALCASSIFASPAHATSTLAYTGSEYNRFYFEDFTADYYLYKDETGASRMFVVEQLTAVFPNTSQNHGITRVIPFTNNDGKNLTMESDNTLHIDVKRNGEEEPVSKVEIGDGYFEVYIGDADKYVTGTQTYTLVYEFQNLVLDFEDWQELYWDANGNDWSQRFNNVTARVHLDQAIADQFTGETSCYVGKYGESGQKRCVTSDFTEEVELSDELKSFKGVEFSTKDTLSAGETLTFVMQFDPDTFAKPLTHYDFFLVIVTVVVSLIALVILVLMFLAYRSTSQNRKYYKNLFVKPEYAPYPDLTVAEAAENYIGKGATGDKRVATLLELAVNHKIEMVKTEKETRFGKKKTEWMVRVKTDTLNKEQATVLKILAGRNEPLHVGQEIIVKNHTATSELAKLPVAFIEAVRKALQQKGFAVDPAYKDANGKKVRNYPSILLIAAVVWMFVGIFLLPIIADYQPTYGVLVGEELVAVIIAILAVVFIASIIVAIKTSKYSMITTKGLDCSNYMEGLKMYIKMAEADRLKMLQSTKGATTTHQGIVKIYEKLLPYAEIFKLEKSWLDELSRYYEFDDVATPAWYIGVGAFSARDFSSAMAAASTSVSNSISHSTVSNSSSGFSGGGGGGFSGGGGGGGGGGGW